ncbi:hypothetical protein EDC45_1593 [Mesocricetibacter intestinalis]|uniref:NfeD-like C-terminal domain-containing protein n=1 Tax=Mesocricetibacter intestinalis TaxID=1521930 RepID=A0A4V3D9J2_9PAST|nr:NfeD family protein [Mesocricetibacter intestinalis]TDQ57198.1 hypothetical protein EDC45_1593 [Mesocricetibacter intestinalis]
MEWLTNWGLWHWLILGFVLLIGEIIIPGIFLLWWGLAALIIALPAWLLPSLSLTLLAVLYALLSLLLSLVWWKYQHGRDMRDQAVSVLNRRDQAMIGMQGRVSEIGEGRIGRGCFGDTTWRIEGEGLAVGDTVEVLSVRGITLSVRKIN